VFDILYHDKPKIKDHGNIAWLLLLKCCETLYCRKSLSENNISHTNRSSWAMKNKEIVKRKLFLHHANRKIFVLVIFHKYLAESVNPNSVNRRQ
jgi:hypothetical protein